MTSDAALPQGKPIPHGRFLIGGRTVDGASGETTSLAEALENDDTPYDLA